MDLKDLKAMGLMKVWFRALPSVIALVLISSCTTLNNSKNPPEVIQEPPVKLYYEVQGEGSPILLIHGFGANLYTYHDLVLPLSREHQLFLLDLKGFGKSPKPAGQKYSVEDQVSLVIQFILQNDLTDLTIVGHSYGGGVALVTALRLIEESPHRLRSLILIDSAAYPQEFPTFIRVLRTPVLGPLGLSLLSSKRMARSILNLAFYDETRISEETIEKYAAPLDLPGSHNALIETAKQIVPPNIKEINARYKNIHVPVLILWGREDKIIPLKYGERLHEDLVNSKLVIFEKTGHIPHEEKPEEVIKSISDFLLNGSVVKENGSAIRNQ